MKILYYDCFSGISGDMNLGALIDLGVDRESLLRKLKGLKADAYELRVTRDQRRGISGTKVEVALPSAGAAPRGRHAGRSLGDITAIIKGSRLSGKVKSTSLKILRKIAEAEAKIHGCGIEDVHFHEIGAMDSLIDIVGAAICLDHLKVDRVMSSPVQLGGGIVKCDHGILPVPAPATAEILRGVPVLTGSVPFETTTPTGAAILAVTVDCFTEKISFIPQKIGYGIGRRDTDVPNVLRVFLGEMEDAAVGDGVEIQDAFLVECNIDDMIPEMYDSILDLLFARGALDVYLTPVIMKKSRPAVKMSVLCNLDRLKDIEETLWLQTTTFGIRISGITKKMLARDFAKRTTKFGDITVKNAYLHGRKIKSKPEYEDVKRLAKEKGVGIKEVYDSLSSEDD